MITNQALLIGHLGKDPVIRRTRDGKPVANFSLATSENRKDADGERKTATQWHDIVVWGPLSEVVEKHLAKGDKVAIQGKIETRNWTDKDGVSRRNTEIVVDRSGGLHLLGSRRGADATDDLDPPTF